MIWHLIIGLGLSVPMQNQDACFKAAMAICKGLDQGCCVHCIHTATGVVWTVGEKGKMVRIRP